MRRFRPATLVLVALLAVIAFVPNAVPSGQLLADGAVPAIGDPAPTRVEIVEEITDGLTLTRIADPNGPQRIFVLTLDPGALTIDVGLPRNDLGGTAPLSLIAARHGALAAVNGDYGISTGRPLHLFAMDGDLVQTSLINRSGRNFAIAADGSATYFGRPDPKIEVRRESNGAQIRIDRWNDGVPAADEIVAYTHMAGDLEEPPSEESCQVRLVPEGRRRWARDRDGIERRYLADVVTCLPEDLPLERSKDAVVLASTDSGARALDLGTMVPGEHVKLTWSLGWPGVTEAIGGSATLLQDGQVVIEKCHLGYECWRHPRTAIGRTAEGRLLIVVIDGRREGWSLGMRREELAAEMQRLGAVDAIALDGGGSSQMVVNGEIINEPSGNEERRLMSALLILPGADPGEPFITDPPGEGTATPTATPTQTPTASGSPTPVTDGQGTASPSALPSG